MASVYTASAEVEQTKSNESLSRTGNSSPSGRVTGSHVLTPALTIWRLAVFVHFMVYS